MAVVTRCRIDNFKSVIKASPGKVRIASVKSYCSGVTNRKGKMGQKLGAETSFPFQLSINREALDSKSQSWVWHSINKIGEIVRESLAKPIYKVRAFQKVIIHTLHHAKCHKTSGNLLKSLKSRDRRTPLHTYETLGWFKNSILVWMPEQSVYPSGELPSLIQFLMEVRWKTSCQDCIQRLKQTLNKKFRIEHVKHLYQQTCSSSTC